MNEDLESICIEPRSVRKAVQAGRTTPWTICLGIWLFVLTNAALAAALGLLWLVLGALLNRVGK